MNSSLRKLVEENIVSKKVYQVPPHTCVIIKTRINGKEWEGCGFSRWHTKDRKVCQEIEEKNNMSLEDEKFIKKFSWDVQLGETIAYGKAIVQIVKHLEHLGRKTNTYC